jgi:hypothetical protein
MSTVSFFSPAVADTRIDAIMNSFNDIRINPLALGGDEPDNLGVRGGSIPNSECAVVS